MGALCVCNGSGTPTLLPGAAHCSRPSQIESDMHNCTHSLSRCLSPELYLTRRRYLAPDGQATTYVLRKTLFSRFPSLARLLTHTLCVCYKAVCTITVIIGNPPILLISTQYQRVQLLSLCGPNPHWILVNPTN